MQEVDYLSPLSKEELQKEFKKVRCEFKNCRKALFSSIATIKSLIVFCQDFPGVQAESVAEHAKHVSDDCCFFGKECRRLHTLMHRIKEEIEKRNISEKAAKEAEKMLQKKQGSV